MHRTQMYLDDEMYEQLKSRARSHGLSISELIRRAVTKELRGGSGAQARAFFERLQPLESFQAWEPGEYVEGLRSSSRIVRENSSADS